MSLWRRRPPAHFMMSSSRQFATAGPKTTFQCGALPGNQWALESLQNGRIVTAEFGYAGKYAGSLRAQATTVGIAEKYTFVHESSCNCYAIRVKSKYVATENRILGLNSRSPPCPRDDIRGRRTVLDHCYAHRCHDHNQAGHDHHDHADHDDGTATSAGSRRRPGRRHDARLPRSRTPAPRSVGETTRSVSSATARPPGPKRAKLGPTSRRAAPPRPTSPA